MVDDEPLESVIRRAEHLKPTVAATCCSQLFTKRRNPLCIVRQCSLFYRKQINSNYYLIYLLETSINNFINSFYKVIDAINLKSICKTKKCRIREPFNLELEIKNSAFIDQFLLTLRVYLVSY